MYLYVIVPYIKSINNYNAVASYIFFTTMLNIYDLVQNFIYGVYSNLLPFICCLSLQNTLKKMYKKLWFGFFSGFNCDYQVGKAQPYRRIWGCRNKESLQVQFEQHPLMKSVNYIMLILHKKSKGLCIYQSL